MPSQVVVREVGPRDGIQSERKPVPTDKKVELLDALSHSGLRFIEAVSFVSPKVVPQMADSAEVWARAEKVPGVFYSALVPNLKGAQMAIDAGLHGLQVFTAASDGYNKRNVGKTVDESMADVSAVAQAARAADIPVEATVSTAFGDPYERDVPPESVADVSRRIVETGINAISYGDTTGMATPRRVRDVVLAVREGLPELRINMHFHDTRGTGLANVVTALDLGIDYFDASIGGMGGSPFATGATGNIVTEYLVHMLDDMDISTGIDLSALLKAAEVAQGCIEGELPSKLLKAGPR